MYKTTEYPVNIRVAAGSSSQRVTFTPPPGKIIRGVIFRDADIPNTAMVNASLYDSAGFPVSEPQHIDNYRSRESGYYDCKPMYAEGGREYYLRIDAAENFTADFNAQLILIYQEQEYTSHC